jgi:hypothetical protein
MNPKLASKASRLPLAKCGFLRIYDTQPLVLGKKARDFSAHFLKLLYAYSVPMVANSSSKYPVCVEIQVPAETDAVMASDDDRKEEPLNDIRLALEKVCFFPAGCDFFGTCPSVGQGKSLRGVMFFFRSWSGSLSPRRSACVFHSNSLKRMES